MCTCGIDIATQQQKPATASTTCSAAGDRPSDACVLRTACCDRRRLRRRPAAQRQRERDHRHRAHHADAEMRLPPADGLHEVLHQRRPDRAGEIVAGCRDRHRDAAPSREPVRDVGDDRPERRRAAEQRDQQSVRQCELPQAGRVGGGDVAQAERHGADQRGQHDAEAVRHAPHHHAAHGEADHRQRVGQRGGGAIDAELRLHRGQHDHHGPQADAADRAQQHADREAQPGVGGLRARVGRHGWRFLRLVETMGIASLNPSYGLRSHTDAVFVRMG